VGFRPRQKKRGFRQGKLFVKVLAAGVVVGVVVVRTTSISSGGGGTTTTNSGQRTRLGRNGNFRSFQVCLTTAGRASKASS
jgi:hypothetical protein